MKINQNRSQILIQIISSLLLAGLYIGVFKELANTFEFISRQPGKSAFYLLLMVGIGLTGLIALIQIWAPDFFSLARRLRGKLGILRWIAAFLLAVGVSYFFIYSKWSYTFNTTFVRLLFYLYILGLMSWVTVKREDRSFEWNQLLGAIILLGSVFSLAHALNTAVNVPFSLSWSEGNRLWDYSIVYGRSAYIFPFDQAIPVYTDRMRQSLWGLPFLLPNPQIWLVRLWSALVWTVPYAFLGWVLLALRKEKPHGWLFFGLWAFLFLNQGPIYTPLILAAILVAGSRRMPTWLAFILVGLAGYYAREGRYTWLFAPAIWSAMLAFLQSPALPGIIAERAIKWQRWTRAGILGAGGFIGCYFVPQIVHMIRGDVSAKIITIDGITNTVGRQPLLWDRLWPSPTNPMGIILQLLLAVGPLAAILVFLVVTKRWKLDFWQAAVLIGAQLAFLIVGIISSVKIGGGNNLHNMDMFLVGMVFAAGLAWEASAQDWVGSAGIRSWWAWLLLLLAIVYPAAQGMMTTTPLGAPDMDKQTALIADMQKIIDGSTAKGEVLFIDQRQLLTFGFIKNVPLVPDYEKKLLMDEALSENSKYFSTFISDLKNHRFSLIVNEPSHVVYRGNVYQFGDENDAWVKWISVPLLCNYEPVLTNQEIGVQLLKPKKESSPDKRVTCP
jgi:hypothetical protein